MEKVNNKNGLDFYYEIEDLEHGFTYERLVILDSNKNYFNDFVLDEPDRQEEIESILNILENTTIEEMCCYYDYQMFDSIEKLKDYMEYKTEDTWWADEELLQNEYVNIIKDNQNIYYCLKND